LRCPAFPVDKPRSQTWIQDRIDISTQRIRIDGRQIAAPGNEIGGCGAPPPKRSKLGHLGAIAGNHQHLATRNPIEHLSPMIA
jgi:hypothetical protein